MAISVVQLGSQRARGEGLRLGTVRRPPRGVPKSEYGKRDYYDVWLPELAPSQALVTRALGAKSDRDWAAFVKAYRREMAAPAASRLLDLLSALSEGSDFSVGCYCADESRCHRSVLRELLRARGAKVTSRPSGSGPGGSARNR